MQETLLTQDDFSQSQAPGTVIGTYNNCRHLRLGIDLEKVISIDNGALRIAPVIEAGFGREVLAYGPFKTNPGLAFAVKMLNGHNTAQAEPLSEGLRQRFFRWLFGSESDRLWERIQKWLRSGRILRTFRQFRWWIHTAKPNNVKRRLDENLAVGWHVYSVIKDPRVNGRGFIMHALGPKNGELWAGEAKNSVRVLKGVQNLPFYIIAVIRFEGTVYYASSLPDAPGFATYPWLRPITVDHKKYQEDVYLGIQQSVLGQIGFRLDTRIYGIRVGNITGYHTWCGGAHAADRFKSKLFYQTLQAECGGTWRIPETERNEVIAFLDPGAPSGLIYALVFIQEKVPDCGIGLVWRYVDKKNHWRLVLNSDSCRLVCVSDGRHSIIASKAGNVIAAGQEHRIQILDCGKHLMAYIDGDPVADDWIIDQRLEDATIVGLLLSERGTENNFFRTFEAHPREIRVPQILDMGPFWERKGSRVLAADDFNGTEGDLEGRMTSVGKFPWKHLIGEGYIGLNGNGAASVRASVQHPCPGRTAYGFDWPYPEFADLTVLITPPGTQRGQKQKSRAGLILYHDHDNYVTLNFWLDDSYEGASFSSFFKVNGFENLYDAIWTNVDDRIRHGRATQLRMCCDGTRFLVYLDQEPVLFREFKDVYPDFSKISINKVGIVANWEWGCDTGSVFEKFEARV